MKRLDRPDLERIEREAKTSVSVAGLRCAEHSIQDALRGTLPRYMYYDDVNEEHDRKVSEAWGDFYCLLNEVLSD